MGISAMNNAIKNNLRLLKNRRRNRFVHMPGNLGKLKKEKCDHLIIKTRSTQGNSRPPSKRT